jgi:predicted nucleic acid-binding protein
MSLAPTKPCVYGTISASASSNFGPPSILPIELVHSLTRAERQGRITQGEGVQLFQDIMGLLPALHDYLPLLPRAYEISSQARIGVYDCLYVVLAEQEGCELITSDNRPIKSLQPTFPFITSLVSLT